jgi:hypothetical protein
LAGKSELMDDLADLVAGMDRPFDATARAFLLTIGNAAKASAKREARPMPSARRTPAPPPEPTPAAPVDFSEMLRRRLERDGARRMEEFGRSNAAAWGEQAEMVRGMGAGGDWR